MIDLTGVKHHPAISELVEVLCNKTQNTDQGFFRVELAYFLGKVASNMRATIATKDRGEIPVNIYVVALATSGFGKGHSVGIIENEIMAGFRQRFCAETFDIIAYRNLTSEATDRSLLSGKTVDEELEVIEKEYIGAGEFPYTFDSGTVPAIKQLRHKLLLAKAGAINLQIDEIGSNILDATEILNAYLELYDQGKIKQKLTKNTNENVRAKEIDGKTPTNMLLFGTPAKLLDGGKTEDHFYDMLATGFGRRCHFNLANNEERAYLSMSPEDIYFNLTDPNNKAAIDKWANIFYDLACPTLYEWTMTVNDQVGIKLTEYRVNCERAAHKLPDHEEIRKAELTHRYFKALKLAGAYAFVDKSPEVTLEHLMSAILLTEESGNSFSKILDRDKSYMKVAKYIASTKDEVTHADLFEALPFYKSGAGARNEMMTMARAWGYKENIIIKNRFVDGIEFFRGETLKETNTQEMIISFSDDFARNYEPTYAPLNSRLDEDGNKTDFDFIDFLQLENVMQWCNHRFKGKHRTEENAITGFNMIVVDIDEGVSLKMVHELMADYKFITYTTKRHTEEVNRFRLILPIKYELHLDTKEYKAFMSSFLDWLPFSVDEATQQRSRKWETYPDGTVYENDGELLDITQFIPDTTKNDQFRRDLKEIENLDNLERWFAVRMVEGNRNNLMLRFAMVFVDNGYDFNSVSDRVLSFNKKLNNGLMEEEIHNTIMVSVAKRYQAS